MALFSIKIKLNLFYIHCGLGENLDECSCYLENRSLGHAFFLNIFENSITDITLIGNKDSFFFPYLIKTFHHCLQDFWWFSSQLITDMYQRMTKAEHNRPILKLFIDRPSASASEVFGLLICHWKFPKKYIFLLVSKLKKARNKGVNLFLKKNMCKFYCNSMLHCNSF